MQRLDSNLYIFKVYTLIGDTYMAMGSPIDAIDYYSRARDHAAELEQKTITDKLQEAIARLDRPTLPFL